MGGAAAGSSATEEPLLTITAGGLRRMVNTAVMACMACGTNGRIIAANADACALLRYPILVGRSVEELVPAELRGNHAALRASMLQDPLPPRPIMV